MTLPIRRLIRAHGNSTFKRAAFIFCATLFTCALFTGIIILYLVVLPYLHEHGFEESTCVVAEIEHERPIIKCENRCSRERSRFPCLRCVTHFCQRHYEENEFAVQVFRWRLIQRPIFRCFVSSELHGHEALMHKFHRASTVTYGIVLPVLVCLIALMALLLLWYFYGCHVWQLQDEQSSLGFMVARPTVVVE
nr:calcium activated potassium channel subunit [Hymenolepis microstoma]